MPAENVTITSDTGYLLGDVDSDSEVTIVDATNIQKYDVHMLSDNDIHTGAADVDEDGIISIIDATHIQRHLASLPTKARIGEKIRYN